MHSIGARLTSFALMCAAVRVIAGCSDEPPAVTVPGGRAESGKLLIEQYGCGTCHEIPGVRGARGAVGPPLESFPKHIYIAGKFPNEPETLVRWIQDPPALAPRTAMPDLGVSEAHARDIAAFLYQLD